MTTVIHMLWGLERGGKERLVSQLVRRLSPNRFQAPVWTLCREGELYHELAEAGHPVRFFRKRSGFDPMTMLSVRRAIRAARPAICHTHEFTSAATATMASIPNNTPKVIMTLHGGFLDLLPARRALHSRLLSRAAAVTAVSEHLCRAVHHDTEGQVQAHWIPPAVDTAAFDAAADPPLTRDELGVAADGPLIAAAMRLEPPKNPLLIVRAARRVCREVPACRFVIAGEGQDRVAAERLADEEGLRENVIFVGERGDIPRLIKAADICLLASVREGLPLAVLESMAGGRPVVATDVGGVKEAVEDGVNGFLVAPYDDAAMARRILELLRNPSAAAAMGAEGRATVESRFSLNGMVQAYEHLYEALAQ